MKYLPASLVVLFGLLLTGALTNDAAWSYLGIGFGAGWCYCAIPVVWTIVAEADRPVHAPDLWRCAQCDEDVPRSIDPEAHARDCGGDRL